MELLKNENIATNTVEIEFRVPPEEFEEGISRVFRKASSEIIVPGFRKGRAPRNIIEKMYGPEIFFNDAVDELLPQAYEDAVNASGAVVVAKPDIEVIECSKENGFTVRAVLTTYPEVTLGQYKGLKAERKVIPVTDEVVSAELSSLQDRNARLISVEGRPAREGDTVNIDFEGKINGVAFDGGKGENVDLELGSGQFIPGFEQQVEGHNINDEFDVTVTFPENYADNLAGKEAVFKTKINDIKIKELPELDDEFAKDVSEFDTLEDLKADIRKKKEEEAEHSSDLDFENKLIQQIIDEMQAVIPEAMFENRVDDMVQDFQSRLAQQGLDLDTYLKYAETDMEKFRDSFRSQAEESVKIRLALEKIVKLEDITATDEEYEDELMKAATSYNFPINELRDMLRPEDVKLDLCIQKAIDLIRDSAEVIPVSEETPEEPVADEKEPEEVRTEAEEAEKEVKEKNE